jgi:hypothetical protein
MERYAERTLTVPDNVYVVEHREKGGLQPVDGLPSGGENFYDMSSNAGSTNPGVSSDPHRNWMWKAGVYRMFAASGRV